jgi:hypothetical protein
MTEGTILIVKASRAERILGVVAVVCGAALPIAAVARSAIESLFAGRPALVVTEVVLGLYVWWYLWLIGGPERTSIDCTNEGLRLHAPHLFRAPVFVPRRLIAAATADPLRSRVRKISSLAGGGDWSSPAIWLTPSANLVLLFNAPIELRSARLRARLLFGRTANGLFARVTDQQAAGEALAFWGVPTISADDARRVLSVGWRTRIPRDLRHMALWLPFGVAVFALGAVVFSGGRGTVIVDLIT